MEGDGAWGYVALIFAVALGVVAAGYIGGFLNQSNSAT